MTMKRRLAGTGLTLVLGLILITGVSRAEVTPEWIARLPVGSALTAGLQGMVVDDAGVSYVTGISGPSYNTDITTAAYNPEGSLIWSHTFNGSQDWHDQSRGITLGPGGVVYVTGNTPGPGSYANVLLLKYDAATGDLLDTVQYSSGPFTSEHGASVATDLDGNVYIAGGTVGDGADALILKFDSNGQFQWRQTWDGDAWGPYSQDHGEEILVAPDGNPVVRIHGVMASLHPDFVVVKYDATNGATIWEANWGVNGEDSASDMEIDASGDVFVTGTGIDFHDKFSTIRLRGSDGSLLWQAYDSAGAHDYGVSVALDGQGGVYITGGSDPDGDISNFNDNFFTVKRDAADGSFEWSHLYGANCVGCFDQPSDVIVDLAGNVYVAGGTSSPPYGGDMIVFVIDSETGAEVDRGVISGDPEETAGAGILAFDGTYNLYNGGGFYNFNTGAIEISVVKYGSRIGNLYMLSVTDLVPGSEATFSVENGSPGETQYIVYSLAGLGSRIVPGLGVTLDLENPQLLASGPADGSGLFQAVITVPPQASGRTIWFQTAEQGRTTPVISRIVH